MPVSGFRLFRIFGITVYLHFTWFIVALYEIQIRRSEYSSIIWPTLEVLTLFGIVLVHEFGHALACRSVGGKADRIVLWPLGGVAYVQPPPRPGAVLWSIAAGPLVNVVLFPITLAAYWFLPVSGDAGHFVEAVFYINTILLIFNILPIYPLDGGQIFQALLWFIIGRANSLMVAAIVGCIGALGFAAFAIVEQNWWIGIIAIFGAFQSLRGLQNARALRTMNTLPRRQDYQCPTCHAHPIAGPLWRCGSCGTRFDMFATSSVCPACGKFYETIACPECQNKAPLYQWRPSAPLPGHFPVGSGEDVKA